MCLPWDQGSTAQGHPDSWLGCGQGRQPQQGHIARATAPPKSHRWAMIIGRTPLGQHQVGPRCPWLAGGLHLDELDSR